MKNIRLNLIVILLFRLGLAGVMAQEAIPAAGGEASGKGGKASYTVGQLAFTTISGITGLVMQGVQQPYEITITKESGDAVKLGIECLVYPNPVTDQLRLRVEMNNGQNFSTLSYRLYSFNGTLLLQNRITEKESIIPVQHLAMSAYVLQVYNNSNVLVEFTIIKN